MTEDVLAELGAPTSVVADVGVAITEACANVVRHASGAEYSVALRVESGECEVEVLDLGRGLGAAATPLAGPRGEARDRAGGRAEEPDATEPESGRGLILVRSLVDQFQFTLEPSATRVRIVKRWRPRMLSPA